MFRSGKKLTELLGRQESIGKQSLYLAKALTMQGKAEEGLPYAQRAVEIFTKLRVQGKLEEAQALLIECGG
ncbi:MAG: hypothetical protein WCI01_10830 [Chlorobiaceae bacterium]